MVAIILFQSCKVYYKTSVPLNTAIYTSDKQMKKIKTLDGEVYKLRSIEKRNGRLYGKRTKSGITSYMNFTEQDIKSIKLQNKALSIGATIAIIIMAGGAVAFGVFLLTFDLNLGTIF